MRQRLRLQVGKGYPPLPHRGTPAKTTRGTYMEQHLQDLVFRLFVHFCHLLLGECSRFIGLLSSIAPEGWGPKEGGNAMSPLHSRGSPNKGGQNQKSKPPLGVTMMPLGAPSISKYGSLVRPNAQIVALRAHYARTALKAPPRYPP